MKELLYLKDEQIKEFIEKLFLSYRDTFSESKAVLNKYSLGIAHNKVLHILSTYKGITIGELLNKHVYLNEKGEKIFDEIFSKQKKRIYNALLSSSAKEVVDFNKVLKKLINSNERI